MFSGQPIKKREKRRKSKEEKIAERRVIFWTLLIILLITVGFWLAPKIGGFIKGEPLKFQLNNKTTDIPAQEKSSNNNYVEISL